MKLLKFQHSTTRYLKSGKCTLLSDFKTPPFMKKWLTRGHRGTYDNLSRKYQPNEDSRHHTHKHSQYMPRPYISLHICLSNRCSIKTVKHIITQTNEVAHGSLRTDTSFLWKANRKSYALYQNVTFLEWPQLTQITPVLCFGLRVVQLWLGDNFNVFCFSFGKATQHLVKRHNFCVSSFAR